MSIKDIQDLEKGALARMRNASPSKQERDFKGIWISKKIWLAEDLIPIQKIILAEIDSLDTKENGCYASNKYFSKFFKMTERGFRKNLSELKEKGYVVEESFDGRFRVLHSKI